MENLIFSMYFFEFPEHEKKYRDKPRKISASLKAKGYNQDWLEAYLARIDEEGTKISKLDGELNAWQNRVFRNITGECSNFVHMNFSYLESVNYGGNNSFVLGPNWINRMVIENGLWKIIEATLINLAMFDRVFHDHVKDAQDMELFTEIIDSLNKWKNDYA